MSHDIKGYLNIPFSSELSPHGYYTYESISDLIKKCDENREKIFKCRTIGILESKHGIFNMKEIDLNCGNHKNKFLTIKVSMIYMKQPLFSIVKPQTIQLFGTLQWKKTPIIYANIVQVLISPVALQLSEAMKNVKRHLVKPADKVEEEIH